MKPTIHRAAALTILLWTGAAQTPAEAARDRGQAPVRSRAESVAAAQPFEPPRSAFDAAAALEERAAVHAGLLAEMVSAALAQPYTTAPRTDLKPGLDRGGRDGQPVRVGEVRPLGVHVAPAAPGAALRLTAGGGYVLTAAVRSPGAAALRLHLSDFWLAEGAELHLFTGDGQVFGPYTGRGPLGDGDFWTHTVIGDQALLQLRQRGPVPAEAWRDTWFDLVEVAHVGPEFLVGLGADADSVHCQYNAPCIQNVNCSGTSSAVNDARLAVAHMQWVAGAFIYMCSGGLLADTVGSSQIPYFLTANHCLSRAKDARNLECFFQLDVPCGTTSCDDIFGHARNHPQSLRTLGSTVRATGTTGDYTLLELGQPAPAGSAFLGWSTTAVANSNNTPLYRVSHPGGAPQGYSEHAVSTSRPTCQGWPRGSWIYSVDTYGATEGGSSGSPVLNDAGQVVGQLSGACGTNTSDNCDSSRNSTVDGAFAAYFSAVQPYLDPTPCSPTAEVCNDAADNDCDGAVDCADSNCTADPACAASCGSSGTACSTGADCCSGNCRRGTCKGN